MPRLKELGGERVAVGVALLFVGVALLAHARSYWVNVDDAFIAFRYAENLASGFGLVFNDGERVEGYTDFLWVVLLAGLHRLGANTPTAAQYVGALFGIMTLPVLFRAGRRSFDLPPWVALLPCAIVAASAPFAAWMGSGLEMALYAFLFTLALYRMLIELRLHPTLPTSGALFGVAALTRPEAIGLFVTASFLAFILRAGRVQTNLKIVAGFLVVTLPHLAFRFAYYGYLLPNTFYAKVSLEQPMIIDGWLYVCKFGLHHGPWALPVLLGLWISPRSSERWRGLLALAVILVAFVYITFVGGDFYDYSRFCVPYVPWLALLLCVGAHRIGTRWHPNIWRGQSIPGPWPRLLPFAIALSVMLPAAIWPDVDHRKDYETKLRSSVLPMTMFGNWLRTHYPPNTVIAVCGLGRIPYYSRFVTIDMLGLADSHIAHRQVEFQRGRSGHQKFDSEYVLSREPTLVVPVFGTDDPAFAPHGGLNTEMIYQSLVDKKWWLAPTDLVRRRAFRIDYAPRSAEIMPGLYFLYFERDATLRNLIARASSDEANAWTHLQLARRYRHQGLSDEALTSIQRAVSADPALLEAQFTMASLHREAQDYPKAQDLYSELHQRFPNRAEAGYGLALTLYQMGEREDATLLWRTLLHKAPDAPEARQARRLLRNQEGKSSRRERGANRSRLSEPHR